MVKCILAVCKRPVVPREKHLSVSRPPIAPDEEERLAALQSYALLDTPPEPAFERLSALAARLFHVPLALMTLIDQDRQWIKSCQGLGSRTLTVSEIPRDIALCAHTILSEEVLVVEDARTDPRFAQTPLVIGNTAVRFYAGAPLITADGYALGTLCVMGFQPRSFSAEDCANLADLAAGVISEIELRRASATLSESEQQYRQMFENNPHPMWVFDRETLQFLDVNETALARYGYERTQFLAMTVTDILLPEDNIRLRQALPRLERQVGDKRLWRHRKQDGTMIWAETAVHGITYQGRAAFLVAAHDVTERLLAEESRRLSEARKAAILETALDCIITIDHQHRILEWNPAAEKTFGYSRAETLGQEMVSMIVPLEFRDAHHRGVDHYLATGEGPVLDKRVEVTAQRKDGSRFTAELTAIAIQTGEEPIFTAYLRDITERKEMEDALRGAQERLNLALQAGHMGLWDCDLRTGCITGSGSYTRLLGLTQETFGHTFEDFLACVHPEDRDGVTRLGADALAEKAAFKGEHRVVWPDGTVRWLAFKGTVTQDAEGNALRVSGAVLDITDRKALELEREELLSQTKALLANALEQADHDPLTGLLNHRAFHKRLKEETAFAVAQNQTLCLLLMDLDNFKFFNDAYGHLAGDGVLKQVAQALRSCARPQDILARYGSDEFTLLMPNATRYETAQMAKLLHEAISQVGYSPPGYDTPIPLSLCVSIARLPEDGASPSALLETADVHLRFAKTGGDEEGQAVRVRRTMAHSVEGFSMLDALVTAVDNKDRYTRRHSEDVLTYSVQIARELGLDQKTLRVVEVAALLHDVGKIGIPDSILRKPGALSREDFQAIQQHPLMGAIIVGAVPGFEETLDAVRHHHERWDGGGYPFGLRETETPLMARLMAVADAYSAMTTDRPYRKGMPPEKAKRILQEGAGTQWDPDCVAAFLRANVTESPSDTA